MSKGAIKLDRVEVAVTDERGFFRTAREEPIDLPIGRTVRVSLYWEALAAPNAERTVSVRITDASGAMIAAHDMQPSKGARPTSWWEPGWNFRDVYYMTVPPQTLVGPGRLDIRLYDSFTLEPVPFDPGVETLKLCDVTLVEP